jgi:hypothetical protein
MHIKKSWHFQSTGILLWGTDNDKIISDDSDSSSEAYQ